MKKVFLILITISLLIVGSLCAGYLYLKPQKQDQINYQLIMNQDSTAKLFINFKLARWTEKIDPRLQAVWNLFFKKIEIYPEFTNEIQKNLTSIGISLFDKDEQSKALLTFAGSWTQSEMKTWLEKYPGIKAISSTPGKMVAKFISHENCSESPEKVLTYSDNTLMIYDQVIESTLVLNPKGQHPLSDLYLFRSDINSSINMYFQLMFFELDTSMLKEFWTSATFNADIDPFEQIKFSLSINSPKMNIFKEKWDDWRKKFNSLPASPEKNTLHYTYSDFPVTFAQNKMTMETSLKKTGQLSSKIKGEIAQALIGLASGSGFNNLLSSTEDQNKEAEKSKEKPEFAQDAYDSDLKVIDLHEYSENIQLSEVEKLTDIERCQTEFKNYKKVSDQIGIALTSYYTEDGPNTEKLKVLQVEAKNCYSYIFGNIFNHKVPTETHLASIGDSPIEKIQTFPSCGALRKNNLNETPAAFDLVLNKDSNFTPGQSIKGSVIVKVPSKIKKHRIPYPALNQEVQLKTRKSNIIFKHQQSLFGYKHLRTVVEEGNGNEVIALKALQDNKVLKTSNFGDSYGSIIDSLLGLSIPKNKATRYQGEPTELEIIEVIEEQSIQKPFDFQAYIPDTETIKSEVVLDQVKQKIESLFQSSEGLTKLKENFSNDFTGPEYVPQGSMVFKLNYGKVEFFIPHDAVELLKEMGLQFKIKINRAQLVRGNEILEINFTDYQKTLENNKDSWEYLLDLEKNTHGTYTYNQHTNYSYNISVPKKSDHFLYDVKAVEISLSLLVPETFTYSDLKALELDLNSELSTQKTKFRINWMELNRIGALAEGDLSNIFGFEFFENENLKIKTELIQKKKNEEMPTPDQNWVHFKYKINGRPRHYRLILKGNEVNLSTTVSFGYAKEVLKVAGKKNKPTPNRKKVIAKPKKRN